MPYLPHAVMASVRDLAGRVVAVRIRDSGANSVPRYQLLLDVELTQHPSRAVVRGVKFFAPLTITLTKPHPEHFTFFLPLSVPDSGTQIHAPRGNYDGLIDRVLAQFPPDQRSITKAAEYLTNQLKNTPVMLQTIGGVWTISQI